MLIRRRFRRRPSIAGIIPGIVLAVFVVVVLLLGTILDSRSIMLVTIPRAPFALIMFAGLLGVIVFPPLAAALLQRAAVF